MPTTLSLNMLFWFFFFHSLWKIRDVISCCTHISISSPTNPVWMKTKILIFHPPVHHPISSLCLISVVVCCPTPQSSLTAGHHSPPPNTHLLSVKKLKIFKNSIYKLPSVLREKKKKNKSCLLLNKAKLWNKWYLIN